MCTIFVSDITINGSICAFQPRLHRCNENVCCIRWRRLSSIDFTISRFLSLSVSLSHTAHTHCGHTIAKQTFSGISAALFNMLFFCHRRRMFVQLSCRGATIVVARSVNISLPEPYTSVCVCVCVCALHDTCIGIRKIGARLHHHMHRNSIP